MALKLYEDMMRTEGLTEKDLETFQLDSPVVRNIGKP